MFKKTIIPLLKINTNLYVFLSGILVSFATNIFTALCDKDFDITTQWQELSSTVLFIIAGAICMYIGVTIADVQEYIKEHKTELENNSKLIEDVYGTEIVKWYLCYFFLALSLFGGFFMLVLNWLTK